MKIWESRATRYAIFKTVPRGPDRCSRQGSCDYAERGARRRRRGPRKEADQTNVMVVNKDRKIRANFARDGEKAGEVKLQDGDRSTYRTAISASERSGSW